MRIEARKCEIYDTLEMEKARRSDDCQIRTVYQSDKRKRIAKKPANKDWKLVGL